MVTVDSRTEHMIQNCTCSSYLTVPRLIGLHHAYHIEVKAFYMQH